MTTKAQKIVEKDISDRLNKIAFHFEERFNIRIQFEKFTAADYVFKTSKTEKVKRVLTRIQSEELSLLIELVHLLDNLKKYLKLYQLNMADLRLVEKSKQYIFAANFVNTHKHGSRGRNKPSAIIDYYCPIILQEGEKPKPSDRLLDIRAFINFEGDLFDSVILFEELVQIWMRFLFDHTSIDIKQFQSRINTVLIQTKTGSRYSAKIPTGVFDDAKKKADERKHIDL